MDCSLSFFADFLQLGAFGTSIRFILLLIKSNFGILLLGISRKLEANLLLQF